MIAELQARVRSLTQAVTDLSTAAPSPPVSSLAPLHTASPPASERVPPPAGVGAAAAHELSSPGADVVRGWGRGRGHHDTSPPPSPPVLRHHALPAVCQPLPAPSANPQHSQLAAGRGSAPSISDALDALTGATRRTTGPPRPPASPRGVTEQEGMGKRAFHSPRGVKTSPQLKPVPPAPPLLQPGNGPVQGDDRAVNAAVTVDHRAVNVEIDEQRVVVTPKSARQAGASPGPISDWGPAPACPPQHSQPWPYLALPVASPAHHWSVGGAPAITSSSRGPPCVGVFTADAPADGGGPASEHSQGPASWHSHGPASGHGHERGGPDAQTLPPGGMALSWDPAGTQATPQFPGTQATPQSPGTQATPQFPGTAVSPRVMYPLPAGAPTSGSEGKLLEPRVLEVSHQTGGGADEKRAKTPLLHMVSPGGSVLRQDWWGGDGGGIGVLLGR